MEDQVGTTLVVSGTRQREVERGNDKCSLKLIMGMIDFRPEFNQLGKH